MLQDSIANLVSDTSYDKISADAIHRSKTHIFDYLAGAVAAVGHPTQQRYVKYVKANGQVGSCHMIGVPDKTSSEYAALYNGALGHILDYDDANIVACNHSTASVVPTLMALADANPVTGKQIVQAFVIGTEVQWKFGEAIVENGDHYTKGWHSTGTIGSFGAVAAAASLLGFNAEKAATAMGIVASDAAGLQAQFGTDCKAYQCGRSSQNGVRAVNLADAGITSAADVLEGLGGFFELVTSKRSNFTLELWGAPWAVLQPFPRNIRTKLFPVCGAGNGIVETIQSYLKETRQDVKNIEAVHCYLYPHDYQLLRYHRPKNAFEAKFSQEYWIAATIIDGALGLEQVSDARVSRQDVQDLISRITVSPDENSAGIATFKLDIHTKDGSKVRLDAVPMKGSLINPVTEKDIFEKGAECFESAGLDRIRTKEVYDSVMALDEHEQGATPFTLINRLLLAS